MAFRDGPFENIKVPLVWTAAVTVVLAAIGAGATERAAQDMLAYCAPGATKKKRPPAERPEPVPQRSAE